MSEHRLISIIRANRKLAKKWNALTSDEKHFVIEVANGDDTKLAELIKFAGEK